MRSSTHAWRRLPLVALGALLAASGGAAAQDAPAFCLTILHNNDAESQLLDAGSRARELRRRRAFVSLVEQQRAAAAAEGCAGLAAGDVPRAVVTLSSGDNFLAGPEFNACLEKGPPFYDSLVVNAIGYDALAIGNHEFDFGPDVLADFIDGRRCRRCRSSRPISICPASRACRRWPTPAGSPASVVLERAGQKIAVIGATTEDLPFISSPRDVTVGDVAAAVKAEIEAPAGRRRQGHPDQPPAERQRGRRAADSSSRASTSRSPAAATSCWRTRTRRSCRAMQEDVAGPYPMLAPDATGKDVPVITTSGNFKYLGRLEVLFDGDGRGPGRGRRARCAWCRRARTTRWRPTPRSSPR